MICRNCGEQLKRTEKLKSEQICEVCKKATPTLCKAFKAAKKVEEILKRRKLQG